MPFYLRKSINLGPLRLNFSKSGIGFSLGVTGLRIGTGPKGKYLHMGRHGIYYRKSLDTQEDDNTANDENTPPLRKKDRKTSTFRRLWPIALAIILIALYLWEHGSEPLLQLAHTLTAG